jgi:hypothetical protein
MPETGLEPAPAKMRTSPSSWRVCQFRHSGFILRWHLGRVAAWVLCRFSQVNRHLPRFYPHWGNAGNCISRLSAENSGSGRVQRGHTARGGSRAHAGSPAETTFSRLENRVVAEIDPLVIRSKVSLEVRSMAKIPAIVPVSDLRKDAARVLQTRGNRESRW